MTSIKVHAKRIFLGILTATPMFLVAQNPLFEKLAKLPEVEYSYLSRAMLSKAEDLPRTSTDINKVLSQLNSIEVLVSDSHEESYKKICSEINSLHSGMKLISQLQNDGEVTQIFGAQAKVNAMQDSYSEILFINNDADRQELTAILFTGTIEPDSIKDLLDY